MRTPKAGPALDRLIAEKVMGLVPCEGWEPMNFGSAGGAALMKKCKHVDGKCYPTGKTGSVFGEYDGVPAFSRNRAVAAQVVDRMEELGFCSFQLRGFFAPTYKHGWSAGFVCNTGPCKEHGTNYHDWHGAQDVKGATECEAICLAALKAMKSGRITRAAFKSVKGKK